MDDVGSLFVWLSVVTGVAALITGRRRWLGFMAIAVGTATAILTVALLVSDFSLAYVARTTSLSTPWVYRLAALWGGMEGSLLFYLALTLGAGWIGARSGVSVRVVAAVGVVLAAIVVSFADPFAVLAIPAVDGQGLLAILQHPAMVYHPPILYGGLVATVVPFALTISMLRGAIERDEWRAKTVRWMYLSWLLLTIGMAAGSNWAYVELGWGGFWAWDPVENTALMPWLGVTGFIHLEMLERVAGRLRRTTAFSAMVPFATTVAGVYLTRSGATGSIHSFAEDPIVGGVLLIAAALTLTTSAFFAVRSAPGDPWQRRPPTRQLWLLVNAALLGLSLVFVFVGSAWPAVRSVFFGETLIVDARFFVSTIYPIALVMLAGLGLSLGMGWRRLSVMTAITLGLSIAFLGLSAGSLLSGAGLGVSISLAWLAARSGTKMLPVLAHLGMAVLLTAFGASALGDDFRGTMGPGDTVEVGGEVFTLESVETGSSGRIQFVRASLTSSSGLRLTPEIRAYENQALPVAEPDLASNPARDVIAAISLLFPDGETVEVSLFVRPLVWWVWVGSALIALAGLVRLFGRGEDVAGRRRPATAAQQQGETTSGSA